MTLNHDTLVEQILDSNGIRYVDGFGQPDGDVRWGDDAVYENSSIHVRLFKLHGSVNWHTFLHEGLFKIAIFLGSDLGAAHDGAGKLLAASRGPSFLSGINKSVSYNRGIYADIHFRFQEQLRKSNRMIMSGYGWGDTAINFQIENWLDRDRSHKLVLLHQHPDELLDNSLIMASGYNGWVRSGKLAVIDRWLSDVSLSDIREYLV